MPYSHSLIFVSRLHWWMVKRNRETETNAAAVSLNPTQKESKKNKTQQLSMFRISSTVWMKSKHWVEHEWKRMHPLERRRIMKERGERMQQVNKCEQKKKRINKIFMIFIFEVVCCSVRLPAISLSFNFRIITIHEEWTQKKECIGRNLMLLEINNSEKKICS